MARVLVVEDDEAIRDAVAYNLESDGHEVVCAVDGLSGIEAARTDRPDLIVLDIMLPRMSGLDVCRLLREEESAVPILMLTARGGEADRVHGLDLGADDYMAKPFSMRELRARVSSLLRRDRLSREAGRGSAGDEQGELIAAGEIVVDVGGHEVRRNGVPVALRPREYELLEFLMRHPGQALSRETILERVWGYSYPGGERTVDVHMRWLRQKLEDTPSSPRHLQTVRGVGYKFAP